MPEKRHWTVQEAADEAHLSPATVQQYASGMTDLVRGEDFYIHRFGRYRKRLYFTSRGIQRLKLRAYRVFRPRHRVPQGSVGFALPWRYTGSSLEEQVARLATTVREVITAYMRNSPCAVPNCPCMVHRLGLPQADEIAGMRQAVEEAKRQARGGRPGRQRTDAAGG